MDSGSIFTAIYKGELTHLSELVGIFGTEVENCLEGYALIYAVMQEKPDAVNVLLSHGACTSVRNYLGDTPLCLAAKKGFLDIVMQLCEHGASIDEIGQEVFTPLSYAVKFGHYDVARYLVRKGASVDISDDISGLSPYLYALNKDGIDIKNFSCD